VKNAAKYKIAIMLIFTTVMFCSCSSKIELSPYIITQDGINNIDIFGCYTYNNGRLYYTKSSEEHGGANRFFITDLNKNITLPTGLNLDSKCFIWDDYLIAETYDRAKSTVLGLVDKDNFNLKPLIKEKAFKSDTVKIYHYQPYYTNIIIMTCEEMFQYRYGDPDSKELEIVTNYNLYNYDTSNRKMKKIKNDYHIYLFWIYNDVFFFTGGMEQNNHYNLYALNISDIGKLIDLKNAEMLVENIEPKILFCNEYLIFSSKNENKEKLIYKIPISGGEKALLVKDSDILLENVNGDWIYYINYDENIFYRVHVSTNDIEVFYDAKEIYNLSIQSTLGKDGFICTDHDNIYHLTLDKKIKKIE